jgi:hypothetical protein
MPRTPDEVRLPSQCATVIASTRSCARCAARCTRSHPWTESAGRAAANLAQEAALDAKVKEALDCPCVADLRNSSCGAHFTTGATRVALALRAPIAYAPRCRSVHVLRAVGGAGEGHRLRGALPHDAGAKRAWFAARVGASLTLAARHRRRACPSTPRSLPRSALSWRQTRRSTPRSRLAQRASTPELFAAASALYRARISVAVQAGAPVERQLMRCVVNQAHDAHGAEALLAPAHAACRDAANMRTRAACDTNASRVPHTAQQGPHQAAATFGCGAGVAAAAAGDLYQRWKL